MEIHTTEMHTGGEPLRIVEKGFPKLTAPTLISKRREVLENYDDVRKFLMLEPRGHNDMYGAILCDSELEEADFAVLFTHNQGLSTMCGHAVIALARYAVEKGLVEREPCPETGDTKVNIHCPCGLVRSILRADKSSSFVSVPSYVVCTDLKIQVSGKEYCVDVAYGGAFYTMFDCNKYDVDIQSECIDYLRELGDSVKREAFNNVELFHPNSKDLCFMYGTIFMYNDPQTEERYNLCIFADKQVDRSACGSGVTARMALEFHKSTVNLEQVVSIKNSKVEHSCMSAKVVETIPIEIRNSSREITKAIDGVTVEITGKGYFTGSAVFTLEEDDLLSKAGFRVQ